mgnify:CR=1 FL=1
MLLPLHHVRRRYSNSESFLSKAFCSVQIGLFVNSLRLLLEANAFYSHRQSRWFLCAEAIPTDVDAYRVAGTHHKVIKERMVAAMRLDKYLKVSRLIKRRTVANEACDAGRVIVNGKVARASYDVKEGDRLELRLGQRPLTVEVLAVHEYAKKEEAALLYRVEENS